MEPVEEKMASFDHLSPEEVCMYLKNEVPTISQEILDSVIDHKIDGEVFLEMNDEYLREIAPLLGDRLKIKRAVHKAQSHPSILVKLF